MGRFEQQGWLFHPQLALDLRNVRQSGWNAGLIYADQRYHQYIYDVAPQYATATRPAYSVGTGYSGAQVMTTLSKRYDNFWIGGFMKWATSAARPLPTARWCKAGKRSPRASWCRGFFQIGQAGRGQQRLSGGAIELSRVLGQRFVQD